MFETAHVVPEIIQREFAPKRVEKHLNGVLLVYSENSRWIQGIYVDKQEVAGWGGSGLEVEPWFPQVAWVSIKKRELSNRTVQRMDASRSVHETNPMSSAAG